VREALRSGENQSIEFKHGVVEHQLMRAVTAFANSNSGTIFIGLMTKVGFEALNFQR